MAVDPKFSLEQGLKRFLDRCPNLKLYPLFDNFLTKGGKITEKEFVAGLAELILHPNYTIPLLGCFRPIAPKIVESTVGLLRLVPDLRSGSATSIEGLDADGFFREDGFVNSPQEASFIDIYYRKGRGLHLHELACLAFCRTLDLFPFLLRSVLDYFEFAPAPFERILLCQPVLKTLSQEPSQFLTVVRISYRFLILETEVFKTFWDWSCFLDLVQLLTVFSPSSDSALRCMIVDLTWCTMGILSVVLRFNLKIFEKLSLDSKEAFLSFLRWQEFCMDVSLEKAGWHIDSFAEEATDAHISGGSFLLQCQLRAFSKQSSVAEKNSKLLKGVDDSPFLMTSAMNKRFGMISLAVSQRWPVLLYGPPGSGKTSAIKKLASSLGCRVLSIHMDEQADGRTLVGSYVCTEQPGEFLWQPGLLTQAVVNGFWVVFEDIDKAPPDVFSILLPLLEGAIEFSAGHGQSVKVNDGFRLLATVTSSNPGTSSFMDGRHSFGAAWLKVIIDAPSDKDLVKMVLVWYPDLEPVAPKLIETFERVNQLTRSLLGLTTSSKFHSRFTLRDLLRLSKRIASGIDLTPEIICKEAIDVFASFTTSEMNRLAIITVISNLWGLPAFETLYCVNKPVFLESNSILQVGRVSLPFAENASNCEKKLFVELRVSLYALERIACSYKFKEPVLLVGETGTGKTTLVQTLASRLGQKLTVLNLSQQSDVADLLGGFKPVGGQFICTPLYQEFVDLFTNTFSCKGNKEFLSILKKFLREKNWKMLLNGFEKSVRQVIEIGNSSGKKRKRPLSEDLLEAWQCFSTKTERARAQVNASDGMMFSFVEGAFVTALRDGEWILLDEVNLAPPEILQRLIGVLDDENGSLCLAEKGDIDYVRRHPNFRLFACMNPATDAGKRDLANSLRGRFTEYFVDDTLNDDDLILFVKQFLDDDSSSQKVTCNIVRFYKEAKESEQRLQDGANQRPHYSLRSLYRALEFMKKAKKVFDYERSLYDGFSMFFLNLLDDSSSKSMNSLICKHLLGTGARQPLPYGNYLISKAAPTADDILSSYVLTRSVNEHLRKLAQAIFFSRCPVLLQGPTSSGKTSLVRYLAAITGHKFVRINNHEHTDLQEYLGSYINDVNGKLVFQEGALVKAVREGHWVVLDELNLAPSDVLEALNRLLDDNRELYVPELRETLRCHPNFMLFATQNPPVVYGGRKMLSRAFRNRFIEIHVDDIPQEEFTTILEKSCKIPASRAKKIVAVMNDLQLQRQSSKIFAGKHGYITPRDLFRWAKRFTEFGDSDLAYDGYYLMAERLRDDTERGVVKAVLERHFRVKFSDDDLYKKESEDGCTAFGANKITGQLESVGKIVWTRSLWRILFLVERCYRMREPVLLVGETGGGKTTVCQLLSVILGSKLHILNCHQYTETSDFVGGFYPVHDRSGIMVEFQNLCERLKGLSALSHYPGDAISCDINRASVTLNFLSLVIKSCKDGSFFHPDVTEEEIEEVEKIRQSLIQLEKRWRNIFTWQDGPLVEAMRRGELFLVDEISLADDSVLERLNSALEPERKLSLAEKGGPDLETIDAHEDFFLLATMNPGGDFGKKELSHALRNRFTEIWIPSVGDKADLKAIALDRLSNSALGYLVDTMLSFWEWFNLLQTGRILTVRDLLSWVSFINATEANLSAESALVHGAFLVLLDGLFIGTNTSKAAAADLRLQCFNFLLDKLKVYKPSFAHSCIEGMESYGWAEIGCTAPACNTESMECDNLFGFHPFYIEKGTDNATPEGYEFLAPTTCRNSLRVLRALQLKKPVLLEGSPGVGKTSLIIALARFSGHTVVRINLSEQTDIMDLLGSYAPQSDEEIQFSWFPGILLQALEKGSWVLLDELNLAPQSVLEGLNSILDHRAEIFIPELGQSFKCPASFRVFACQNPSSEGGGRKGLPKSFLNRFTKVYLDELDDKDYLSICHSQFPSIESSLLSKLIEFNKRLHEEIVLHHKFGEDGSPWEFNLRDVIRSCQIVESAPQWSKSSCFLNPIYLQRMRTPADRQEVLKLYEETFGTDQLVNFHPRVKLDRHSLNVGGVSIERHSCKTSVRFDKLMILPGLRHCLQALVHCVKHQWLSILVGSSSSGKTSLIRLLAELTGNALNEVNLSSATDISDLLGCFEQYDASRHYYLAISQVERYMNEYSNLIGSSPDCFSKEKGLIAQWLALISKINPSGAFVDTQRMKESIQKLVEILECLLLNVGEQAVSFSWSKKDLESTLLMIQKLENEFQKRHHSVKFEMVTGSLLKAIQNGEWIVLENANLCNPAVLDRINSLVEQSGSITINECGIVDPVNPHPGFRMFFTVNPSFGEVSRAMRNRGVEIYMMHPHWPMREMGFQSNYEIELRETKRFIALSGIAINRFVDMMAKAHVYAKHEGLHLNVSITNLELSRWVELFLRLMMNGNEPVRSLLESWKHTYLSSFTEEKGREIVSQAADYCLSKSELYRFTSNEDSLLCLPGGWPTPLKLKDFVLHSEATFVRQNVVYLESMGYRTAVLLCNGSKETIPLDRGTKVIHFLDAVLLRRLFFPSYPDDIAIKHYSPCEMDLDLTQRKLSFAADWVIEQATDNDCWLYISWFEWFGSRLNPLVPFFTWFSGLLKKELQHSIWKRIFQLRSNIMSLDATMDALSSVPMLSINQIDICQSVGIEDSGQILLNSINCVSLLRRSLQQWSKESEHNDHSKTRPFLIALISLRRIEEKVLDSLVDSPCFDMLFKLYADLLEHHIIFWKSIISSQTKSQLIYGNYLMKYAMQLQGICLEEAVQFQVEMKKVTSTFSFSKSLLWAHGGHPISPSSAQQFHIMCQLSKFCETMCPTKYVSLKQDAVDSNEVIVNGALAANVELRALATHELGRSFYIIGRENYSEAEIVQQLEEIYRRLEIGKKKLVMELEADISSPLPKHPSGCCVFTPVFLSIWCGFKSWLRIQPLLDERSLSFDLELLQHLTKISSADTKEQYDVLQKLSDPLKSSLKFSLHYSSRSPADLLPHQNILSAIDAWQSLTRANRDVSSFIMQFWFRWHVTLWEDCTIFAERETEECDYHAYLPSKFFWPLKSVTVDHILRSVVPVTEFQWHNFKLRAASHNLWKSSACINNFHIMLLSVARALFQQIIYAHKKSFKDSAFTEISFALHSIEEQKNVENMEALISLLESSDHHVFTSLIDSYIQPLTQHLYCATNDIRSVGSALLHIGGLRCNLLVSSSNPDPSLKYSLKCSELAEKIASLEVEMEVREECFYLAGTSCQRDDSCRNSLLKDLHARRKMMQKKIVFRPNPGKFVEFENQCLEISKSVNSMVEWVRSVKSFRNELVPRQVHNWQMVLSHFVDRLSNEYSAFSDIAEPVKVALYEMKLGLSLMLSSEIYSENSKQDRDSYMDSVYKLMRFPRVFYVTPASVHFGKLPVLSAPSNAVDVGAVQNIFCFGKNAISTSDSVSNTMALDLPSKISIYQNILQRIKDSAAVAHFLGDGSFKLLCKIFDEVACLWMKHRAEDSVTAEADQFKFRARTFSMASIIEIDLSNCISSPPNDSFAEWQELLSEDLDEKIGVNMNVAGMDYDWGAQGSDLDGIVSIHNQLFGSLDLVQRPGCLQVSEMDMVSSFTGSYMMGLKMIKDLKGPEAAYFDAKLAPEHLLRLCLEHDDKLPLSHKSTCAKNFYKGSNPAMIVELVEPVTILKQEILALLKEYDNLPVLQRIIEVIDMILALPLDSSLAKALSALEFLLSRIWTSQENFAKFSMAEKLQPIVCLVASWYKLEFESWPALLDEVDCRIEGNVGKLWFPLYAVLLRSHADDLDKHSDSTIKSLQEFFNTSSIGESKKQLQLLLSFHGQITNDSSWKSTMSTWQGENAKILYNAFGFYVQLLPQILWHIGENRRKIEKELNELIKLCRWDCIEKHLTIQNFKRTRLKLRKIVKKYTELLQQPLLEYLGQEMSKSATARCTEGQNVLLDHETKAVLEAIVNQNNGSSTWFDDWHKSLERMEEAMSGISTVIIPSKSSNRLFCQEWKQLSNTVDSLCTSLIYFGELWGDKTKTMRKRRAFSDLFKLLDRCGLSKHRKDMEGQFRKSKRWFLQPSYEMQHLLMSTDDSSGNSTQSHIQSSSQDILWKLANKFYFKSISAIASLENVSQKFHKDISNIQVSRSCSYVDRLFEIQQEQRAIIYDFSKKLAAVRQSTYSLSKFFAPEEVVVGCFPMRNQLSVFRCLWQQKQIFDCLCTLFYEEQWLLQTVEKNHLDSCSSVKGEAEEFCSFIKKVLPNVQRSKDTLDKQLIGCNGDEHGEIIFLQPYGVNLEMEQLVNENFELIMKLGQDLSAFSLHDDSQVSVQSILLGRIEDLVVQARSFEEMYYSYDEISSPEKTNEKCRASFNSALNGTFEHIFGTFDSIGHLCYDFNASEESLHDIHDIREWKSLHDIGEWKSLFEKHIENLQLELICEDVITTLQHVGELQKCRGGGNTDLTSFIHSRLKILCGLLEKLLAFGDNLLLALLRIHSMVCEVTVALANVFSSLFIMGFCGTEDAESSKEIMNDATGTGTGMGEGVGQTDVSDQINDEDQLIGSSQRPNDDRNAPADMPGENEKGIEMEQEFDADAFSVSEDSDADENEDDIDGEEPESTMGAVGDNCNVVDERVGGDDEKNDDDHETNEKYEKGPSVEDPTSQENELRANDDSAPSQETTDHNDTRESEKPERNDEEHGDDDDDGEEAMSIDKDEAFADTSGINPDQNKKSDEATSMDEMHSNEPTEDGESEDLEDAEMKDGKENGKIEDAETGNNGEQDTEIDGTEETGPEKMEGTSDHQTPEHNVDSKDANSHAGGQSNEAHADATNLQGLYGMDDLKNDFATSDGKLDASEFKVTIPDSRIGERLNTGKPWFSLPSPESFHQNLQPNPYRNIGNAMEGWKNRVKVSVDLQKEEDMFDDLVDDNAYEYGYTAEFQQGTAQALGPATANQTKGDVSQRETDNDLGGTNQKETEKEVQIEEWSSDTLPLRNFSLNHVNNPELKQETGDHEKQSGESKEVDGEYQDNMELSDAVVLVRRPDMNEAVNQYEESLSNDDQLGHAAGYEPPMDMTSDSAAADWRRYELNTTRLSQELAEQLRLVLEPTVASKLQGYYKTGKRISMKKVILYIATQYRKDKIWLRRTRPSKRDYQVVIAVDDSRSMSEGSRGNVALEALVTVCRAMSQLEVGRLAVASFGRQGNIRLLHDFDQTFTSEAGMKMISSFTFKQENMITNEPMADLLKYLDNMLDTAAMRARLPSGCNPLQQLVLIIGDGRFSEKEKLKRYVRDMLSKQRMVAFLLLDNPSESILDMMEATVENGKFKFSRYLDTFPFPYYVVLKKIEALPGTLADLLRQWFELMQYARE